MWFGLEIPQPDSDESASRKSFIRKTITTENTALSGVVCPDHLVYPLRRLAKQTNSANVGITKTVTDNVRPKLRTGRQVGCFVGVLRSISRSDDALVPWSVRYLTIRYMTIAVPPDFADLNIAGPGYWCTNDSD